ncbi:MAG: TlpA disulfide reductase family protein [Haliscomenobacter sp.]|uniref:TlpA family protein disulfide reductase n=1 Tax=Haliscomenobacter sp. TaxID=2717303 RepID=UPI0029B16DF5|nr:TlpA disulfide reductase family protein [Haliscomenobacter sp.]MDX2070665.1 TlpA disulfide reductase family protein [Haliscomenobacter sp.]
MKSLILTFAVALVATLGLKAQALQCSPEKPIPGETVTLSYDQNQTILANENDLKATVLFLNNNPTGDRFHIEDVNFVQERGMFKAKLNIPAKANLFYIALANEVNGEKDNNGGKGYGFSLYKADRKALLPGVKGNLGLVKGRYGYYANADRDVPAGLALVKEEFASNPAARKDANLLSFFTAESKRAKDEAALAEAKKIAEGLTNDKKATEQDLFNAYSVYKILDDKAMLETLGNNIRKKYPKGMLVRSEKIEAVGMEKDFAKKVALYESLAGLPFTATEKSAYNSLTSVIASGYLGKKDWANFEKYLNQTTDKNRKANLLNSAAWQLCGEGIVKEVSREDAERSAKYSKQSIDLIKSLQSSTDKADVPAYSSPKQMKDNLQGALGMFSDTYAVCLYRTGKYAEALEYQQIYNETQKFSDPETNERYCIYLEKAKGGKEAEAMLEKLITNGTASEAMKTQFLRLFQANNSPEAAAQRYLANLEADAKAHKREELRKKMIDKEAPDFKLRNLKGEEVALSSLKGKVVILDFWATWCGPCKASFPGMQKSLEATQNRSDVVFLFIDTWENGDNKEKAAAEFIEKNKYSFNVLMDNDNKVVGSYKVEGIPTKFIVGKDGRIKFMSVGFNGTETLIEEVAAMIDLAGEIKP